jgi:hypothetical protein
LFLPLPLLLPLLLFLLLPLPLFLFLPLPLPLFLFAVALAVASEVERGFSPASKRPPQSGYRSAEGRSEGEAATTDLLPLPLQLHLPLNHPKEMGLPLEYALLSRR